MALSELLYSLEKRLAVEATRARESCIVSPLQSEHPSNPVVEGFETWSIPSEPPLRETKHEPLPLSSQKPAESSTMMAPGISSECVFTVYLLCLLHRHLCLLSGAEDLPDVAEYVTHKGERHSDVTICFCVQGIHLD